MSNNWRPKVTLEAVAKAWIRCTAIDVIWREHRHDVEVELKDMLNIEVVDFSKREVFQQRTAAAKRVLMNMSQSQKEDILTKVENYKKMGLPEDIQRR